MTAIGEPGAAIAFEQPTPEELAAFREQEEADYRAQVDHWFTYHKPHGGQLQAFEDLREGGRIFAHMILELCPHSADRTVAIRKLRECVMTANAAIACGGQ